jgi:membrane dipeptidase
LEDVSRYPQLLATLLEDPTWTEEDIKKLAGLNLLRVFAKVEQVRRTF